MFSLCVSHVVVRCGSWAKNSVSEVEFLSRNKKIEWETQLNSQSLVQSPEDRLFGYLQAIRHVMDDPTAKK